jgi:hypothetical protein
MQRFLYTWPIIGGLGQMWSGPESDVVPSNRPIFCGFHFEFLIRRPARPEMGQSGRNYYTKYYRPPPVNRQRLGRPYGQQSGRRRRRPLTCQQ